MSDYISREAAIGFSDRVIERDDSNTNPVVVSFIAYRAFLRELPAADVVEVVRCADCVYCNTDRTNYPGNDWDGSCDYWNTHSVDFSWFCSQGKRKEAGA